MTGFRLVTYSAGEAATITGLSQIMQRDWRRHGFLPKPDGHARHNIVLLAKMRMLKALSDRGIGPSQGCATAHVTGQAVASELLKKQQAYSHPLSATKREKIRRQALEEATEPVPEPGMEFYRDRLASGRPPFLLNPTRFLALLTDGTPFWSDNLAFIVAKSSGGPIILFDLQREADNLLTLTGPVVEIDGTI
jgi:hypothetical protein